MGDEDEEDRLQLGGEDAGVVLDLRQDLSAVAGESVEDIL